MKKCVVTGAGGFIGAYLTRALVAQGWQVAAVDNLARGEQRRLESVIDQIEFWQTDVRDAKALEPAFADAEVIFHLAAINGTENFYSRPELVLDVGLRGALAVVDACRATGVKNLVVASSAEVYQTPPMVPTPEEVPLMLPDSLNPRYSYGGSKIVSELIAFNYGLDFFNQVQVFRPHNVYGPDMGWKHVIPQFIERGVKLRDDNQAKFTIQGDGSETRAFAYVEDVVDGIIRMYEQGENRQVYHIGNDHEVSIKEVVSLLGSVLNYEFEVVPGEQAVGATPRRCPDISKMRSLGYDPKFSLADGLALTANWYEANLQNKPENPLL